MIRPLILDSLQQLHTFSLAADCCQVKVINSVDSLVKEVTQLIEKNTAPAFIVLGAGSNTVFVDDFFSTVLLNKIMGIKLHEDAFYYYLAVGAGENWHELVDFCMAHQVGGFENLALIPGTVGAAPIQNIGAYGVEIERFIDSVEFLDTRSLRIKRLAGNDCKFGYRDSIFKHQKNNQRIITRVFFKLPKKYALETSYGPLASLVEPTAKRVYEKVIAIRQQKLPDVKVLGNAGSFFKNPIVNSEHLHKLLKKHPKIPHFATSDRQYKIPAAWLMDQLGFKGKKQGHIGCHVLQPLVLVNLGGGTGADLLTLARNIQTEVKNHFNIHLENEVRLIGLQGVVEL